MTSWNKSTGAIGEDIAAQRLENEGYSVIARNFYAHWGEIDIIAKKSDVIHFIEVKTRWGAHHGKPYENVHWRKLQHLARSIKLAIVKLKLQGRKYQCDVIGITLRDDGTIESYRMYENIPIPL